MSIIIRLQHLPWSADAADVREFFRGLIIPEGGVHIVGGRDGDVFVQFSSDEDARLAMKNDGKRLKDSKIKLLLSSQKEMQKVIEKARSDYAAGLVTPNFDSRAAAASDDEEESGDKKRAVGRRSRSRSGSKERSHHVQRNAPNANTAPQAIHQATNFQAQQAAVPGVMAQFAAPLQYQAPLQPQPSSMALYGRQMGALTGQMTIPPLNMQQFAMTAPHYLPPVKSMTAGDHDARVGMAPPAPFFNMFQTAPRMPPDTQMTTTTLQAAPFGSTQTPPTFGSTQAPPTFGSTQAPPSFGSTQAPPTFANVKSPEKPPLPQQDRRDRGSLLPAPSSKSMANMSTESTASSLQHQSAKILPQPLLMNAQTPAIADLTQMPLIKPPILQHNMSQQLGFNNNALNVQNMQNQFALGHLQGMLIDQQQQQKPVIDRSMLREGVFMDNVIAAGSKNQQIYEPDACICAENVPKDMLRYGTIRDFFAPLRLEGPDSIKLFDLGGPLGNVYCRFLTRQEAQLALRLEGKKPGVRLRLCSDVEYDNVRDTTKTAAVSDSQFNSSPHFDPRIWHNDRFGVEQLGAPPKNGPSSSYPPSDRRPEQQQQQQLHKQPLANMQQDKIVEISNIPYKTYDQAIWRFIEETRPKRLHRKLRLKDGKWLAFDVAFVEYYSIEDAGSCFKFNGAKFDGRSLNVNWTSSTVLDSSTIRTYNNHPPSLSSSFNRRPSPDYSLGTATSRDEKFPRRRSRSPPPASDRDRSRRREKSRDRDRERSYEKDRDRDRRNRDRKRPRRSSKERSSSRDKRRHTSRSPPSVVDSSKASSSQALSEISPSPLTIAVVEPMVEKDKKERRESIENSANIQPNAKVEMKPTLVPETPEKEPKSAVVDNGKTSTMTCVFMSGLGPNVNVADILNFFKSFNPVPAGVRLNLEPRGTAYVEFDSPAGCEQAFRCKNRHYIGVQMVTLRMCLKSEMTESVQKQHNLTPSSNGSSSAATESKNVQNVATPTHQNKQQNDFNNSTAKTHAHGTRASGIGLLGREPPNLTRNEPLLPNHSHSNGNVVTHNAPPQPLLANRVGPPIPSATLPPSPSKDGGGGQDVVPAAVASIDPAVVAALGPPGAVCFLHNLPPRITLEEICALFPFDARLIEDSVRMHYSHQTGEPTGDCLLAFQASQDAEKACRSINGRLISGRYLQMWIVPISGK